jgi:PAS domain S-box-containing protein
MGTNPKYEELEKRVKELEKEVIECKRAKQEALTAQEKYRSTIENAVWGIFQTTSEGRFLNANQSMAQILGYESPDELITSISDSAKQIYVEPIHRDEMLRELMRQDKILNFETQVFRKDKAIIWLSLSQKAMRDPNGKLLFIEGFAEDITERKRLEDALKASEEKFRTILESIEDGYYEVDIAGNLAFFNDSMCEMLGYSKNELMGMNNRQYVDEENANKVYHTFNKVYSTGQATKAFDWQLIRKDGAKCYVETSVSLIKDLKGQSIGFRGIARDITERKRAEQTLKEAHDQLDNRVKQRTAELAETNKALRQENAERQAAEEALRRSEEKYRNILESIEEGYYEVDLAGNFSFFNDSICRIFGYPKSELIGRHLREFTDSETAKAGYEAFNRVYKTGFPFNDFSWEIMRKDGTKRYVEASASLMKDAEGQKIGLQGVIRDVTERKRGEVALEFEKQRFQTLLEHAPFGIVMIGKDKTWQYINPRFKEMFAYDLNDVPDGKSWFRLAYRDPDDRQQAITAWKEHATDGKVGEGRTRVFPVNCKDGTEKIIQFRPVKLATGDQMMTCEDITEQKRADEALAKRRDSLSQIESLSQIVQASSIPTFVIDNNHTITHWNKACENLTGISAKEMVGTRKQWLAFYTEERPVMADLMVDGAPEEDIIRYYGGKCRESTVIDGAHEAEDFFPDLGEKGKWLFFTAAPLRDTEGNVTGAIETLQDISERKWAEEELKNYRDHLEDLVEKRAAKVEKANEQLQLEIAERKRAEEELQKAREAAESANRTKSAFLANMSHELRTPLNAIIGYSEMLMEDTEDLGQEQFISDLKRIHASSKHLLMLINDVLDLSKIEAGKMELYLETFDIESVIQNVVSTIQPLVDKNSNVLKVQCPDDLGTIHADLTKVRQTLFNLLSNACKFTEQGTIWLEVSHETEDGNKWVIFTVRDTGIGMTEKQMEKLFQAFSQAHTSAGDGYGGTGLGLAITQRFCRMMGGDIIAKSEAGVGSTFTIRLPGESKISEAMHEAPAEPRTEPVSQEGGTVLVIDDEPTVRDLMERLLSKEGFGVQTASGGQEGIRLAKELLPCAITLDVLMPGMDGWSVLSALKADPELNDIPVIMVTIVDDKSLGYSLGASDYLTKPINRERLVTVLEKYKEVPPACQALVVEDDANMRDLLRRVLEKEGWAVTEAENGRVAMEHIARNQPALILLDLMMPEMDGFEFVAELRKRKMWRSIPIIVITAKDITAEDRQRLDGYVEKILQKEPLSWEELVDDIRDLLANCIRRRTSECNSRLS